MSVSKGYGQFCPVAMTSQIFTARWTPLILRELLCGSTRFGDLRKGLPRLSQSLLTRRLDELKGSNIIIKKPLTSGGFEYRLTKAGEKLRPVIEMMGIWGAENLMHNLTQNERDPDLLFWDMRRTVDSSTIDTKKRFVAQFDVSGLSRAKRFRWLVSNNGETDLCYRDPGYEVNLTVHASLKTLVDVWVGEQSLNSAIAKNDINLTGSKTDENLFKKWFVLSPFANKKNQQRLSVNN
ncbi:MAG: helix-turn-helix transcriptional regulator [Gammaproteobacteria bacterium]|nr:helix-turn-helix transcriptional regulator [Gammaproteobacteria bacterium]